MSVPMLLVLSVCILVMAILYSSVGHGGASGYIRALSVVLIIAGFKLLLV